MGRGAVSPSSEERAWDGHPRRIFIESTVDLAQKVPAALRLIGDEVPPCCPRPPLA